jgi:hypothetical protein
MARPEVRLAASFAGLLAFAAAGATSQAQETVVATADGAGAEEGDARAAASRGVFLPLTQSPSVLSQRAHALGLGGYDGAHKAASFESAAEVRVWGPLAVRGGAVYATGSGVLKPSIGARVQALREDRHGVDAAAGVFYRPEGLTEPEGELESVLSLGRHVGATYLVANLLYGQDPEGNERDGELRLGALRPLGTSLLGGLDGRLRFDLGSSRTKLMAHGEPVLDALLGPLATALVGPVALSLQGGGSALRLAGQARTSFGAFVLGGVGAAF